MIIIQEQDLAHVGLQDNGLLTPKVMQINRVKTHPKTFEHKAGHLASQNT